MAVTEVASTQRVTAGNAIEYAYRDVGEDDVPLVLLQHFRGNLDNWDPALIDALAADRRVVTFDNVGVGASTGSTPNNVEAMAHDAIAFLEAMEFERADLLGFSIGSFVAQEIALIRPDLLRRVVLASSAPQGAAGMHGWAPEVIGAVGDALNGNVIALAPDKPPGAAERALPRRVRRHPVLLLFAALLLLAGCGDSSSPPAATARWGRTPSTGPSTASGSTSGTPPGGCSRCPSRPWPPCRAPTHLRGAACSWRWRAASERRSFQRLHLE
jgi:pimeloyl-ACP methyl ester carboxylesterase